MSYAKPASNKCEILLTDSTALLSVVLLAAVEKEKASSLAATMLEEGLCRSSATNRLMNGVVELMRVVNFIAVFLELKWANECVRLRSGWLFGFRFYVLPFTSSPRMKHMK